MVAWHVLCQFWHAACQKRAFLSIFRVKFRHILAYFYAFNVSKMVIYINRVMYPIYIRKTQRA